MSLLASALKPSLFRAVGKATPLTLGTFRLFLMALLLGLSTSLANFAASAQDPTPATQAHAAACHPSSVTGAQPFSDSAWADYQDKDCMFHSTKPNDFDPGADNNGLLYTAEACVIMQLQNVSYDKAGINAGIPNWQVEDHPGLYRHAPKNRDDPEGPDDYIGLGALAGVCGFPDVARQILNYGKPGDDFSNTIAAGLNPVRQGKECYAQLRQGIIPLGIVPYNYNNVDPGKFTFGTWLGKEPAIITHLKIGAGYRPSRSEFAVWSAALLYSGESGLADPPHSHQDKWLQSWLMVLTYQMSQYHSFVADAAVDRWWKMLDQRYPGAPDQPGDKKHIQGMRQSMTEYLSIPGGRADGNPFSNYILDFKDRKDATATMVDTDNRDAGLVTALQGLLTMNCGPGIAPSPCIINDNQFSQANFLAAFKLTLSSAKAAVDLASDLIATHQPLLDLQVTAINHSSDAIASLNATVIDFQSQSTLAQQKLTKLNSDKAEMIAKGLDVITVRLPGHIETHCIKRVFGKCVLYSPPIFIPGPMQRQPNPLFQNVVREMTDTTNQLNNLQAKTIHAQRDLEEARRDLAKETTDRDALKAELDRLHENLTKAQGYSDVAKDGLEGAQATLQNLIPGVPFQCSP